MRHSWCALLLVCILGFSVTAETLNVPADYGTIQAAIDAASHGDVVLVSPGTYVENIDFLGKSITMLSSGGPDLTVIDGNKEGSVVTFRNGEGKGSVIDGFTITNGLGQDFGGGVNCHQSSPSIVNNLIYKNEAEHGGGVSGYITSFYLADNTISLNSATSAHGEGGGIYCSGSPAPAMHPVIKGNTISYNLSSAEAGGIMCNSAYATISENHISNNYAANDAGGIKFVFYGKDGNRSPGVVRRSLIEGNKISNNAAHSGGGIHCEGNGGDQRVISNRIYGNSADYGGGVACTGGTTVRLYNNLIYSNSAVGSIVGGGGGVYTNAFPELVNNTIASNTANIQGGGLYCELYSPAVTNSILWNNSAPANAEIYGSPDVNFCDVKGGWGTGLGNIASNPFFTTGPEGDHYLGVASPCVDAGSVPSMNLALHTCSTRTDGGEDEGMADLGYHFGSFAFPSLTTDVYQVSETGGKIHFNLDAGSVNGNRSYLLVAGATGIEPGFPLPGGVNLPVNFDVFTYEVLLPLLNTIVFQNFKGILSPEGLGEATMNTGILPPGYVGMRMFYAYCLAFPWEFASNPVEIDIVP